MAEFNEQDIQNLRRMAEMGTSGAMTKSEGSKVFKAVVNYVAKLGRKVMEIARTIQEDNKKERLGMEKRLSEAEQRLLEKFNQAGAGEIIKKILSEHDKKMKAIDERMSKVRDGKTPQKGKDYFDGKPGKDSDPNFVAELVAEKLKPDVMEKIEEIFEEIDALKTRPVIQGAGGSTRSFFKEVDISSSLDGSTKTFNIGAFYRILTVDLSSYPYGTLRKNVDYTYDANAGTITFGDSIDAATQLADGQQCIINLITT